MTLMNSERRSQIAGAMRGLMAVAVFMAVVVAAPPRAATGELTDAERARQIIEGRKQLEEKAEEQVKRAFAAVEQTELWQDFQSIKSRCERIAELLADGDAITRMGPRGFRLMRLEQRDCKTRHDELWAQIEIVVKKLAAEFAKEDVER